MVTLHWAAIMRQWEITVYYQQMATVFCQADDNIQRSSKRAGVCRFHVSRAIGSWAHLCCCPVNVFILLRKSQSVAWGASENEETRENWSDRTLPPTDSLRFPTLTSSLTRCRQSSLAHDAHMKQVAPLAPCRRSTA